MTGAVPGATPGWVEVRVEVPRGWGELVAGALEPHTTGSAAIESRDDADEVTALLGRNAQSSRTAIARALASLGEIEEELAGLEPRFRELAARDWANAWRESWKPFRVGRLCVATPEWDGALRLGDRRLDLIPGGTFGTGRHSTTRTCLRVAQERVREGSRVLDAGTGTGILAAAAVLLGAAQALGFDVDPASRPAADELARANGLADRCEFREGGFEVLTDADRGFDGLFANLYSDLIQEHASALAARLAPGGWFAVSGCPVHHANETRAALEAAGLPVGETRTTGKWCTFVGTRPIGTRPEDA